MLQVWPLKSKKKKKKERKKEKVFRWNNSLHFLSLTILGYRRGGKLGDS